MKIHNALDNILNSESKLKILRQLHKTGEESSGRQIAKEIGVSPAACHKYLQELYIQKVLAFRIIGNNHLYSLNNRNIIVDTIVKDIFQKESELPATLGKMILEGINKEIKVKIVSIAIFGSISKKTEKPSSDIDLLMVVKDKKDIEEIEEMIYKVSEAVSNKYGSSISPYIQAMNDFKKKYAVKMPVIMDIMSSHLLIMGIPLERLV